MGIIADSARPDKGGRRKPWTIMLDVVREHGSDLGPMAVAVLTALWVRADYATGECGDRVQTLADLIGASRDSVLDALGRLCELGAVRRLPHPRDGRRHLYALAEPPRDGKDRWLTATDPGPVGGEIGGEIGGCQPPISRGAQYRDPDLRIPSPGVCVRARADDTPPPPDPETPAPETAETDPVDQLARAWMDALPPGAPVWRADHAREIRDYATRLLSQYDLATLLRSVRDPARDRREWPRDWYDRLVPRDRPRGRGRRFVAAHPDDDLEPARYRGRRAAAAEG
jgi:hypothetical protein